MNDSDISWLLRAFANYYWSVPVSLARKTITEWHPDVSPEQLDRVIEAETNREWPELVLVTEGVPEPELALGSMFESYDWGYGGYRHHRKDLPYAIRSEEEILKGDREHVRYDIPEARALYDYVYTELELNDEWTRDVLFNVMFHQEESFMTQESWMNYIVEYPDIKTGLFSSLDQVRRFRDLGNQMYLHYPNPYLRGWKPAELENPPLIPDDIPDSEADIPAMRKTSGGFSYDHYRYRSAFEEIVRIDRIKGANAAFDMRQAKTEAERKTAKAPVTNGSDTDSSQDLNTQGKSGNDKSGKIRKGKLMEDSDIEILIQFFANYYWSVPLSLARETIMGWHPEITPEQFEGALKNVIGIPPRAKAVLVTEGFSEPVLASRVLFEMGDEHQYFLDCREENLPFASRSEEEILKGGNLYSIRLDIREAQDLFLFAQNELGLISRWANDAVFITRHTKDELFRSLKSWVLDVLKNHDFIASGLRSLEQVRRFRDLGNRMYRALPNPYLKGWKPAELDNPPQFYDDSPEDEAEITDILRKNGSFSVSPPDIAQDRADLDMIQRYCEEFVRKKEEEIRLKKKTAGIPKKPDFGRKVGRNEPCPCGSGKKYKKCCGR